MLLNGQIPDPIVRDPEQFGAELTTRGVASGPLSGGNLEMLARSVGVLDMDLRGHIVLLELNRAAGLGLVDRALSQLLMAGTLRGVVGVALGHLQGFEDYVDRGWTVIDVLRERLAELAVPILSGLPLGHTPARESSRWEPRSCSTLMPDGWYLGQSREGRPSGWITWSAA